MDEIFELDFFFQEWQKEIPICKEKCYSFNIGKCPQPPALFETRNLIVKKAFHLYHPSFRIDHVDFFAKKGSFRSLGLLILSSLFHGGISPINVKLTNELSEIKTLVIEPWNHLLSDKAPGYFTKPFSFNYWPKETFKHPWLDRNITDPYDYPGIFLTNKDDFFSSENDFLERDVLRGFGSDYGSVLFAELLLNISGEENTRDEFHLETEGGYRGVAPHSSEVSIWLPGSFNWLGDIASSLE